jgi:hypothetical protein
MTEALQTTPPPIRGVRCSDTDRERTSARLRNAAAAGYLTMDELEERLTRVYAARYGHELDVLVLDLPAGALSGAGFGAGLASGWLAVLAMAWLQVRSDVALLFGRGGSGWSRRRVVLAVVAALMAVAVIGFAAGGFGFGHEGFERGGVEGHGLDGRRG